MLLAMIAGIASAVAVALGERRQVQLAEAAAVVALLRLLVGWPVVGPAPRTATFAAFAVAFTFAGAFAARASGDTPAGWRLTRTLLVLAALTSAMSAAWALTG